MRQLVPGLGQQLHAGELGRTQSASGVSVTTSEREEGRPLGEPEAPRTSVERFHAPAR